MNPSRPSVRLFRTAALAAAAVLLATAPVAGPAAAEESIFWVRDVPAKGKGKTAGDARRDAALNSAPAALDRLLRRLTSARDHEFLPPVPPEQARAMVRGLEVVRAKRRKIKDGRSFDGALSYLFRPGTVGAFLKSEGIAWSSRRSDPVLVLPVWRDESGAILWDDPNPWRDAWLSAEREPGLVPVVLPEGNLKDLQTIDAAHASERDAERLTAIAGAYGAKQVLIAVAAAGSADAGEGAPEVAPEDGEEGTEERAGESGEAGAGEQAEEGGEKQIEDGGLTVVAALFNLRSGDIEELEPITAAGATAMTDAAAALDAWLQERWKDRVIVPDGPVATTRVVLRFDDLAAWVRVRENLVAAPSVTGHRVIAFSRGEARLALTHRGNADDLAVRLPAFGLLLQQERGTGRKAKTVWVLGERVRDSGGTPDGEGEQ
ncbi:MAG: DUF2066 domain-containing protein [Rhodospirillaceae bacterium]|nr:DUF2066 domain-containing protein [Rhodospirillaceae bacterium]MDE0619678.1 DUF2066 domain-containing protein [Rhodospirillaceae bacterium]